MRSTNICRKESVHAAEAVCAALFADEADEVELLAESAPRPCVVGRPWVFIHHKDGTKFGIAVSDDDSPGALYQRLVRLGRLVAADKATAGAAWVSTSCGENIEEFSEVRCRRRSKSAESKVFLALKDGNTGILRSKEELPRLSWRRRTLLRVPLFLFSRALPRRFPAPSAGFDGRSFQWGLGISSRPDRVDNLANEKQWSITMTSESILLDQFPVQIELGTIELSAEELLNLRPGDVIVIPAQGVMTGTLRIAGERWATVEVERSGEEMKIAVKELSIPDEATSGPISR